MRKPIEMEENTNFSLQNQITEFKAGLEKITKPSSQHIKALKLSEMNIT
ncbi:19663_t:CDS:2 [Entrophospora sp. SA101]|nr:19663_t:CDS:2 [Entrophospora sp. SA101]